LNPHGAWVDRWRVVAPAQAVRVDVPSSRSLRRRLERDLRALAPGTPVALADDRPGSRRRCRRLARRSGVALSREYLAVPTSKQSAYLVEDSVPSLRYFCAAVLTVPPSPGLPAVTSELAIRLIERLGPWKFVGGVFPGRVAVGRRT